MVMRIHTRYQGPTTQSDGRIRGSRMIARCSNPRRQLSIPYDYDISGPNNHSKVAYLLYKKITGKIHWEPLKYVGDTKDGRGDIYQVD
jgi:hypothetical protein